MKTAKDVLAMPQSKVKKLVRTIYGGMGQIQRNIAMTNLKKILTKRKDVILVTSKLCSLLLEDRKMKQNTVKSIRKWAQQWHTRRKTLVVVNLIMVAAASRSAKDIVNSTNKCAKSKRAERQCRCHSI